MSILKIGGATVNQTPLDWKGNSSNIVNAIDKAKSMGIELLCFPELAITGYGSEDLFLSRWYPEKALSQLKSLLPYAKDISICIGLPVRIGEALYNCTAVLEDQKVKGIVAKQFLAIDGVHYEFRWFTPWEAGKITSFDFFGEAVPFGDMIFSKNGFSYGFEICEDAWRGDLRPGYRLKTRAVDLIFNPSASHFAMGKSQLREELVSESSIKLNATYFYVNLLGNEAGRMIFDGETLLAHQGKLLLKNKLLSFKPYQVNAFEISSLIRELPEIKSDHDKNLEFTSAITLALFDYMRKSRSKGFVLSLSGGADSSSIAVLVAEMVRRGVEELGIETFLKQAHLTLEIKTSNPTKEITEHLLTTAYQGSDNSSCETLNSAKSLAESLGATFYNWKISEEVSSYTQKIEHAIGRELTWAKDDITLQNIQARVRAPIIWMLANLNNALLLATSNRSEGDVGYATMDGDTSGSISPIAAVDKHFILQWLQWAEKHLGYSGLEKVNSLQPTAELRPQDQHQTDEEDLMPYPVIVEIEKLAIRERRNPKDIYLILQQELDLPNVQLKNYISKFFRLWSRNQWKRERLAPSFHLDDFNVDPKTWCRFPILSGGFTEELHELDQLDQ
ncbi:NAD(+) synthase [Echinicola sp. CAU 1574]|uniref:Glutamine-dependent NAD(+) synthetase n=1 Tax=Echinicola arenosa TaxID=2774144 RepID=A0ABR9AFX1_9BACT|nr:NAD(+) synthase [Echinicola arenosa]MBD8487627.1 NAD(+) synthase [Echinicola arenosa]